MGFGVKPRQGLGRSPKKLAPFPWEGGRGDGRGSTLWGNTLWGNTLWGGYFRQWQ